jgi:hypothetical protein
MELTTDILIAQWDSKQKLASRRQTRLTWGLQYAVAETENGKDGRSDKATNIQVRFTHRHGKCHFQSRLWGWQAPGRPVLEQRFLPEGKPEPWEGFERPKSDMVYGTRPCPRSLSSAINFK